MDSSIVQAKVGKNMRLQAEAARLPRHKSSLGKQMHDEVVSPVKKSHLKLDYNTASPSLEREEFVVNLTGERPIDSLNSINQDSKFAANFAKKASNYAHSSLKGAMKPNAGGGRFHTLVSTSPAAGKETDKLGAYGDLSNSAISNNLLRLGQEMPG